MSLCHHCYHVYVDSINRTSGSSSNFKYAINVPNDGDYDRVVVLNALIPKTFYLVEDGKNAFTLTEGAVDTSVTIPAGAYSLSMFRGIIGTLLTNASPNGWVYVCNYPDTTTTADTGKYTFVVTGNSSQPSITVRAFIHQLFGFHESSTNTFVANQLTSTHIVKFQSEDRLYLVSDLVASPTGQNILQEFNCSTMPSFSNFVYQCTTPEFYAKKLTSKNIGSASFALIGQEGNNLDLNGCEMSFTLLFYKENKIYDKIEAFLKYLMEKEKLINNNNN